MADSCCYDPATLDWHRSLVFNEDDGIHILVSISKFCDREGLEWVDHLSNPQFRAAHLKSQLVRSGFTLTEAQPSKAQMALSYQLALSSAAWSLYHALLSNDGPSAEKSNGDHRKSILAQCIVATTVLTNLNLTFFWTIFAGFLITFWW